MDRETENESNFFLLSDDYNLKCLKDFKAQRKASWDGVLVRQKGEKDGKTIQFDILN